MHTHKIKTHIVNICLDRNTLVLMIDKRSPRRTKMQKAEKKIQAFKSWILFLLGLYVSSRKSSHENKSHTHNDFSYKVILHENIFAWKVIIYFWNCIIDFDIKNIFEQDLGLFINQMAMDLTFCIKYFHYIIVFGLNCDAPYIPFSFTIKYNLGINSTLWF